ncbi:DUF2226 domain-containing protein [Methanococcus aeolicus]|uniref:DUF2226 domain-containing protein n=1 Tax=Methanococcus aeolicus TaxID=42879 RepID=UPI0021C8521F|nr:DUF2226 domain-containing protein [Methanococcus aeolicus]UXM84323.1 DUF2226 domain-containing protein [Methanococcus aeolicus]
MNINVIEGNFIKAASNYGEIEQIAKNLTGYLRISVKKDGGFEEGYIFVEGGQKIGYYHIDGMDETTGKKAEELISKMKEQDCMVEVYEYNDNKLNVMKDMFGEIFKIGAPKEEEKTTIKNTDHIYSNNKDYDTVVLNIPEGAPLNMGVSINEYKQYLSGYKLIEVFNKDNNEYKKAYIIYDNNTPILMAYEDNNGVLCGESSKNLAEDLLNNPNSVVDIFDYDINKINILKEYCPKMNLMQNIQTTTENNGEEDEDLNEFMDSLLANNEKKKEEEEHLSKEELMKKLGIRMPDDELIDNYINLISKPTPEELLNLKKDFEEKIHKIISNEENISSYSLDVSVEYDNRYICRCNIEIMPKKKMGFIKKKINILYIIDKINSMIRENILDITPEVNIIIK